MKKFIPLMKFLCACITIVLVCYFIGLFLALEFNPFLWSVDIRAFVITLLLLIIMIYYEKI